MRYWVEHVKTVVLTLLILGSFLLTTMLWSNRPQFQLIEPAQYVKSKPVQSKQLIELVTPESVVFHYGEDRHTRVFSNLAPYSVITGEMQKWYFYDFIFYPMSEEKWETVTRKSLGLEIQFRSNVPIKVASQLFNLQDEGYEQIKGIDRLWLYYVEEEGTVFALFIDTEEEKVLRAKTSISVKDLRESFLLAGNRMPEQILKVVKIKPDNTASFRSTFWHIYYLPKGPYKMRQFLYSYFPITDEDLIQAYFLDRTLVRQIVERDRTVILTDGSRSILRRPEQHAITFTDPAFQQGSRNVTAEDKVKSAISFINSHLGWTDDYHFEKIEENENGEDIITFRQYVGAYPIISMDAHQLDTISIMSEAGQVVTMKRSLIDLDKYIDDREWEIMSGPQLFQHLREVEHLDTRQVRNAYLAYQAKVHQGYVELMPVWVVEAMDGSKIYVTARKGGEKANGLE
jgi:regulatory protein YycH of two-component signal transduction system YycFG